MVIALLFASVILFVSADFAVRAFSRRALERRVRREREAALGMSLRLDFSREAKTLKRAEVVEPAARILCVDDEAVVLDSFRKILVLDGYCVDTVETGQEVLGLIRIHQYDFVFTDLRMPAMDGVEVVKAVKHMRPDIDVIIITGYATVETAVDCMKHGAMDYVQKPFTEDELRAFVKKSLIRRQDRLEKQLRLKVNITHLPEARRARAGEFSIPGGVLISGGHCWASMVQDGSVKVGLDDFAKKLLGSIDGIDFPNEGMTVKAGQPLFSVRQKHRRVQFYSPVSGQVVRVNPALRGDCAALDTTPYQRNWVCVIDADSLDVEVPKLRIGRSAVAFYQDDFDRFLKLMGELAPKGGTEGYRDETFHVGELAQLDDAQWDRVATELFRPA
jgi:CheY-like chemotaxis protein